MHNCDICAAYNNRKGFSALIGYIPLPGGPFRHIMVDHVDMIELIAKDIYQSWWIDTAEGWKQCL